MTLCLARVRTHLELARIRREWAKELEQANNELEAFSYSVSHDLRAPLRAIDGFSQALLDEYGEKLDTQACQYLQRVRTGTKKMSRLIDDLLKLASMSRAVVQKESINLTALPAPWPLVSIVTNPRVRLWSRSSKDFRPEAMNA